MLDIGDLDHMDVKCSVGKSCILFWMCISSGILHGTNMPLMGGEFSHVLRHWDRLSVWVDISILGTYEITLYCNMYVKQNVIKGHFELIGATIFDPAHPKWIHVVLHWLLWWSPSWVIIRDFMQKMAILPPAISLVTSMPNCVESTESTTRLNIYLLF